MINKILIVTQTPPALRKHPGGDRTGDFIPRAKISAELAKVINDGLFYYEKDLAEEDVKVQLDQLCQVRLFYTQGHHISIWGKNTLLVQLGRAIKIVHSLICLNKL